MAPNGWVTAVVLDHRELAEEVVDGSLRAKTVWEQVGERRGRGGGGEADVLEDLRFGARLVYVQSCSAHGDAVHMQCALHMHMRVHCGVHAVCIHTSLKTKSMRLCMITWWNM